jgi:hypothetical protein
MRCYYRLKARLKARALAAREAAAEAEWRRVARPHATHGERLDFMQGLGL